MVKVVIDTSAQRGDCFQDAGLARIIWSDQDVYGSKLDSHVTKGFEILDLESLDHVRLVISFHSFYCSLVFSVVVTECRAFSQPLLRHMHRRGHARTEYTVRVFDADLDREHHVLALFERLDVARREFRD